MVLTLDSARMKSNETAREKKMMKKGSSVRRLKVKALSSLNDNSCCYAGRKWNIQMAFLCLENQSKCTLVRPAVISCEWVGAEIVLPKRLKSLLKLKRCRVSPFFVLIHQNSSKWKLPEHSSYRNLRHRLFCTTKMHVNLTLTHLTSPFYTWINAAVSEVKSFLCRKSS